MDEMTYEWLVDYQQRASAFSVSDLGCGMLRFKDRRWRNKGLIVLNTMTKKVYPLVWPDGEITVFKKDDIDWESVDKLEHNNDARELWVNYHFSIGNFENGVACIDWMLYPDGLYFADEDGFGMEDFDEVNVSAYIDTNCRVLVKFQEMEELEKRRMLREEACKILRDRNRRTW